MMQAQKVQKWIGWGLVIIVALMPFHAFLSVYLGSLTGHRAAIQAWKEGLTVILSLLAGWLLVSTSDARQILRRPVNLLIIAFAGVGLIISLLHFGTDKQSLLFGIKTDLEFLALFVIAQLAANKQLEQRLGNIILITGGLVGLFGVFQVLLLPKDFLAHFGYTLSTVLPYHLVDPAVPNSIRIISTLSGPNQLGEFLILPICLSAFMLIKGRRRLLAAGVLVVSIFTLFHSYSRSAWIGTIIAIVIVALASLSRRLALGLVGALIVIAAVSGLIGRGAILRQDRLQYYLLHGRYFNNQVQGSDEGRLSSLSRGVNTALHHPYGEGLGTAGPASYRSNQPFITENTYLQLAIETGLLGLVLFILIISATGYELLAFHHTSELAIPLFSTLIGLSAVNLFLHGWADSSTALIFWIAAGSVVGRKKAERPHG